MNQNSDFHEHLNNAMILLDEGNDLPYIETALREKDADPQHMEEIMKQMKRLNHLRRNKKGRQLLLVGTLLLGSGFIASVLLHLNGSTSLDFPLYGLTAAGIVVVLAGLFYFMH